MTVDERALPERITWPSIPIGAGEVFEIQSPKDAARLSYHCRVLKAELARMQSIADEVLKDQLRTRASRRVQYGDLEVSQKTGTAVYDADAMHDALHEAREEIGLDEDAIEGLFVIERKVADGKELNALGNRNDALQKIVVAHTTRKAGALELHRKKTRTAGEAAIPEAVHRQAVDEARTNREAEDEASELGI